MKNKRIVVIGTSAGGLEALRTLVGELPATFPAPIFVVQHMATSANASVLLAALGEASALRIGIARDGQEFEPGHVYIAPVDFHLLVKKKTLLVTKGARENRYRPAIDPLFRSAAVTHGAQVISVILTGMLDDGTAGTTAVKRCGGTTIVQDPKDAAYPAMPRSALVDGVDHCVPLRTMGALLDRLARTRVRDRSSIPADVKLEAVIAERVVSDVRAVDSLGKQVPYNCPGCGGVLWDVAKAKTSRYRCHVGHSYTADTLLAEQSDKIEETLWFALRMLEERRNLLGAMKGGKAASPALADRESEALVHIARIRELLLDRGPRSGTKPRSPAARRRVKA